VVDPERVRDDQQHVRALTARRRRTPPATQLRPHPPRQRGTGDALARLGILVQAPRSASAEVREPTAGALAHRCPESLGQASGAGRFGRRRPRSGCERSTPFIRSGARGPAIDSTVGGTAWSRRTTRRARSSTWSGWWRKPCSPRSPEGSPGPAASRAGNGWPVARIGGTEAVDQVGDRSWRLIELRPEAVPLLGRRVGKPRREDQELGFGVCVVVDRVEVLARRPSCGTPKHPRFRCRPLRTTVISGSFALAFVMHTCRTHRRDFSHDAHHHGS
jgi:hypothetical protein